MTCIIGLEYEDKGEPKVVLGCDSMGSNGDTQDNYDNCKIFAVEPFLIGYTSSFRMGQLLEHGLSVPLRPEGVSDYEYLIALVIPAIKELFKDHGYARVENNEEEGGEFILAYNGRVYVVQSDYSILRSVAGFTSVGCGETAAKGALYALKDYDIEPIEMVELALQAAERYCSGVRGPFHILIGE